MENEEGEFEGDRSSPDDYQMMRKSRNQGVNNNGISDKFHTALPRLSNSFIDNHANNSYLET
jgi:hypothetical protein